MSETEDSKKFRDSQEAAFRRVVRDRIRKSSLTKTQRDIVLAFVNHWFHHRSKSGGMVHPGRKKLAKRAGASINSVKRTLQILRDCGAIRAEAHLNGLHGNATEYTVSVPHLMGVCEASKETLRLIGGPNEPTQGRAKMSHRNNNVVPFPSQRRAS